MHAIQNAIKEHADAVREVRKDPSSVAGKQRQLETKQTLDQAIEEAVRNAADGDNAGSTGGAGATEAEKTRTDNIADRSTAAGVHMAPAGNNVDAIPGNGEARGDTGERRFGGGGGGAGDHGRGGRDARANTGHDARKTSPAA